MHVSAALAQAAGVAKYVAPVSDTSCRITTRTMVALVLLFDVRRLSMRMPPCRRKIRYTHLISSRPCASISRKMARDASNNRNLFLGGGVVDEASSVGCALH